MTIDSDTCPNCAWSRMRTYGSDRIDFYALTEPCTQHQHRKGRRLTSSEWDRLQSKEPS